MQHINSSFQSADSRQRLTPGQRVYFIGIGGISMGGLAELATHVGLIVGGSDMHRPARLQRLESLGIQVDPEQSAERIAAFAPDIAVFSSAVPTTNPQRQWATSNGVVTLERAAFLGWLNQTYERVINIAGTNGKTTTTAMCALMLMNAEQDPAVHLGAELRQFDMSTVHVGRDHSLMVSEACEYRDSFLQFYSTTGVILNIDLDHTDYFKDIDAIITSFARFGANLPEGGYLIVPAVDPHIERCLERMYEMREKEGSGPIQVLSFGIVDDEAQAQPDLYAKDLTWKEGLPHFTVYYQGQRYCEITMALPGRHNVLDALAAMLASELNGGNAEASQRTLEDFTGAEGRFNVKGSYHGATVIADYAHNPSKTRATMEAAHTLPHKQIHVVYQPLTYGRVKLMWDDYVTVLDTVDRIIFVPIYSDREQENFGMSSELLVDAYQAKGKDAIYAADFDAVVEALDATVEAGDLILFLGPEEVRDFADELLK